MFPRELDHAKVLYYTPKDEYGCIYYENGDIADRVGYLAIGRYRNEGVYYLFLCDENYGVVGDSVWDSVEECMSAANSSRGGDIIWIDACNR